MTHRREVVFLSNNCWLLISYERGQLLNTGTLYTVLYSCFLLTIVAFVVQLWRGGCGERCGERAHRLVGGGGTATTGQQPRAPAGPPRVSQRLPGPQHQPRPSQHQVWGKQQQQHFVTACFTNKISFFAVYICIWISCCKCIEAQRKVTCARAGHRLGNSKPALPPSSKPVLNRNFQNGSIFTEDQKMKKNKFAVRCLGQQ